MIEIYQSNRRSHKRVMFQIRNAPPSTKGHRVVRSEIKTDLLASLIILNRNVNNQLQIEVFAVRART